MDSGIAQYVKTRKEEALQQALESAIRIDSSYPDPYFNLAILAEGHENWPSAIAFLSVAVLSSPVDSAIHKRAQQQLDSVRAIAKNDATPEGRRRRLYAAAIARATTFLNNGLLQPAVSEAAVAAKIDPDEWEAYAVAADALSRGKQPEESRKFLDMALARAPVEIQKQLKEAAQTR
jgi:tetratricopeptide (TPR) repeat protein